MYYVDNIYSMATMYDQNKYCEVSVTYIIVAMIMPEQNYQVLMHLYFML